MEYYQVDTLGESLISMTLSPSGEVIAFGDEGGRVHIWGSKDNPRINSFPKPIHWPKTPLLHRPPALLDDFESLAALPFTGLITLKDTLFRRLNFYLHYFYIVSLQFLSFTFPD
jgi:hypothetical protein